MRRRDQLNRREEILNELKKIGDVHYDEGECKAVFENPQGVRIEIEIRVKKKESGREAQERAWARMLEQFTDYMFSDDT